MKTYNWNSDESYSEWIDDVMKILSIPSTERFAFCGEHGETLDLNWDEKVSPEIVADFIRVDIYKLKIRETLVGKRIIEARYMTEGEMRRAGWSKCPLIIFFEDGSFIVPMQDDEGNDGGALQTSFKGLELIPTL